MTSDFTISLLNVFFFFFFSGKLSFLHSCILICDNNNGNNVESEYDPTLFSGTDHPTNNKAYSTPVYGNEHLYLRTSAQLYVDLIKSYVKLELWPECACKRLPTHVL